MKNRPVVFIFILCLTLMLSSCTSWPQVTSPIPLPSPPPKCIGDTWSYAENIQTEIEISPDLRITMEHSVPGGLTLSEKRTTIYGDRRAAYTDMFFKWQHGSLITITNYTVEKQITEDQLSQIVTAFEEANFYAITPGCEGKSIRAPVDGDSEDISIVTDGKTHEINEQGACWAYRLDKYCSLYGEIDAILGTPWYR